jgi:tRNA G18 (ribose-2'-O)-methylase SpoU
MESEEKICFILPNIRSLHNVGSVFRIADSIGAEKIYLTGYTGTPPAPQIAKVSLGAETWIPWEKRAYTAPLLRKLKKEGYTIVALEQTKQSFDYRHFKPIFPLAIIIGNEVQGVKDRWLKKADVHVKLPMCGFKNSLNVSVATGIIAYAVRYRH